MKPKIFLTIVILSLLSLAVFVSAMELNILGYGSINGNLGEDIIQTSVKVSNGWNLIKGFPSPDWIFDGDVSKNQIKGIYALDPFTKEYVQFYPKNDDLSNLDIAMDFLIGNTAFWVYVEGLEGELEYYTIESYPLENKQLFSGWNFIGITNDFIGKELNDIKGSCNIQKAFVWEAEHQEWVNFIEDSKFYGGAEGSGLVIKVSSDCKLGTSTGEVEGPPAIPN